MNDKDNTNIQVYQIESPKIGDSQGTTEAIVSSLDNALFDIEEALDIDTELMKVNINNPPSINEKITNIESRIAAIENYARNELDTKIIDYMGASDTDLAPDQRKLLNAVERFNSINKKIAKKTSEQGLDIQSALQPSETEVQARGEALFEQLQKENDAKRLEKEEMKLDMERLAKTQAEYDARKIKSTELQPSEEQKKADLKKLQETERSLFGEGGVQLDKQKPKYEPIMAPRENPGGSPSDEMKKMASQSPKLNDELDKEQEKLILDGFNNPNTQQPEEKKSSFFDNNKKYLAYMGIGIAVAAITAAVVFTGGLAAIPGIAAVASTVGISSTGLAIGIGFGTAAGIIGGASVNILTNVMKAPENQQLNNDITKSPIIYERVPPNEQSVQYSKLPDTPEIRNDIQYDKLPDNPENRGDINKARSDAVSEVKEMQKSRREIRDERTKKHVERLGELAGGSKNGGIQR